MKATFISTSAISSATRLELMKVQVQLAEAQKELVTGRFADVGLEVGFKAGQSLSLRQEHTRLKTIIDTNSLVTSRLDTTQAALKNVADDANTFLGQLLASNSDGANAAVIQGQAQSNLDAFINTMNTTFNGGYLFAGVNTDVKPLTDYTANPPSTNQQAVANAFLTDFGITQSDPAVPNITGPAMQTFLDTTFSGLFDDPAWITDWSSASNQNVRNRISTNDLVETSVNTNDVAFRKLAKAYTMVADLGTQNLGPQAYTAVINQAIKDVSEAIQDVNNLQSGLGITQQRVADSSERMGIQVDILTSQVNSIEGVDPNEAATRVNELMTQIETSYALTAKIMGLSILNFL
jgi:flagellar hook-associated protein 3 FlgL